MRSSFYRKDSTPLAPAPPSSPSLFPNPAAGDFGIPLNTPKEGAAPSPRNTNSQDFHMFSLDIESEAFNSGALYTSTTSPRGNTTGGDSKKWGNGKKFILFLIFAIVLAVIIVVILGATHTVTIPHVFESSPSENNGNVNGNGGQLTGNFSSSSESSSSALSVLSASFSDSSYSSSSVSLVSSSTSAASSSSAFSSSSKKSASSSAVSSSASPYSSSSSSSSSPLRSPSSSAFSSSSKYSSSIASSSAFSSSHVSSTAVSSSFSSSSSKFSSSSVTSSRAVSSSYSSSSSSSSSSPTPYILPRISLRGTHTISSLTNDTILLRGWNWGHWGLTQPQDAQDNKDQGANIVRIPLRWWGLYGGAGIDSRCDTCPGLINPDNLAILDNMIGWAVNASLWIDLFVDSNCGQNGLQAGGAAQYCDPNGTYPNGHNFFTDLSMRANFTKVWQFVANRYKDVPWIAFWEPLPEPGNQFTIDGDIVTFYNDLMVSIRAIAPGIPFILGGNQYSSGKITSVYNPLWKDVIYTEDLFLFINNPDPAGSILSRIQNIINMRDTYNVPVFVQQVGSQTQDDPTGNYTRIQLSNLNANYIGWTYWEYRDGTGAGSFGPWYVGGKGQFILKNDTLQLIVPYLTALATIQ